MNVVFVESILSACIQSVSKKILEKRPKEIEQYIGLGDYLDHTEASEATEEFWENCAHICHECFSKYTKWIVWWG